MLVWVKEYINKKFITCKSLSNSQELYTAFKEKHPNVNIGFSKFCTLRSKWCVLAGWLKNNSLGVAKMKLDKVINTIKSIISEIYKVKVDCWEDSKSDSHD